MPIPMARTALRAYPVGPKGAHPGEPRVPGEARGRAGACAPHTPTAGPNRSAVSESAPPAPAHPGERLPLPPRLPRARTTDCCLCWDHQCPQCAPPLRVDTPATTASLSPVS